MFLYIDPGTGSLLLYAIIGIASSLWFLLKGFFYKLYIKITAKLKNENTIELSTQKISPIVIYSEGNKYFHIFEPVILELIEKKIPCTYVTSDKNDNATKIESEYFNVIVPGNDLVTISFMNKIKCDIVLATTPHLDIYMWKKSKKVKRYIHLFHAPTGVDYYEKYALSFYDAIMSVGDFTHIGQDYLDKKRNLPLKEYYSVGNTYYDKMVNDAASIKRTTNDTTILYAPTWGLERSSFFKTGKKFVYDLLKAGYTVIFRPHPQFYTSHKEELQNFLDTVKDNKNFILSNEPSPLIALTNSDLMISDYSGVVLDYAYLYQRPILLSTSTTSSNGYEAEELPIEFSFDEKAIQTLGHELSLEESADICKTVDRFLKNKNEVKDQIIEFRNSNLFNFGNAGKKAAEVLIAIENNLTKEAE